MRTVSIHALNLTHSVQWRRWRWALLPLRLLAACLSAFSLPLSFTAECVHATTHYARRSLRHATRRVLAPVNGKRRVKCFPPHLKGDLSP